MTPLRGRRSTNCGQLVSHQDVKEPALQGAQHGVRPAHAADGFKNVFKVRKLDPDRQLGHVSFGVENWPGIRRRR
jgi:hypothetical protein